MKPRGWHSRGFLPHFDGGEVLQFITVHLGDAMPVSVVREWKIELENETDEKKKLELHRRVEKYLDQGIGDCYLGISAIAEMVQESLVHQDGKRYKLIAWVIMPNHVRTKLTSCSAGADNSGRPTTLTDTSGTMTTL
ncbi:MAG: hypothetical protein QM785_17775 [Pyrinomonadaceae bacterium]